MKQAKYPAYLSIALFESIQKTLVGFSKRFKEKQQRVHFIHLILTIINQGSTRLREANQIVKDGTKSTVENLSHFLKNTTWSLAFLSTTHTSFLVNKIPKRMYVAIDMTALAKTGKKFEYLDKVHDGRDKKIKDGFNLLMSLGISQDNKKENYVLNHKVISTKHPKWLGENLEIIEHLKELKSFYKKAKLSLKNIIHIADRGFDREPIVRILIKLKCLFIIRAKDKNITLKNGIKTKLYQLPLGAYHKVYIKTWKIYLNVIVVKAREREADKEEVKMVLLTTISIRKLGLKKAKTIYQTRWQIETVFKKLKSDYGLEDFRVRKWIAIQKIISLTILACNVSQYYLRVWKERISNQFKKTKFNIFDSIYYLRKYIQRMLNFGFQPELCVNLTANPP
jgi:hypothetical protein